MVLISWARTPVLADVYVVIMKQRYIGSIEYFGAWLHGCTNQRFCCDSFVDDYLLYFLIVSASP
jgi:hypothetical protein